MGVSSLISFLRIQYRFLLEKHILYYLYTVLGIISLIMVYRSYLMWTLTWPLLLVLCVSYVRLMVDCSPICSLHLKLSGASKKTSSFSYDVKRWV